MASLNQNYLIFFKHVSLLDRLRMREEEGRRVVLQLGETGGQSLAQAEGWACETAVLLSSAHQQLHGEELSYVEMFSGVGNTAGMALDPAPWTGAAVDSSWQRCHLHVTNMARIGGELKHKIFRHTCSVEHPLPQEVLDIHPAGSPPTVLGSWRVHPVSHIRRPDWASERRIVAAVWPPLKQESRQWGHSSLHMKMCPTSSTMRTITGWLQDGDSKATQ